MLIGGDILNPEVRFNDRFNEATQLQDLISDKYNYSFDETRNIIVAEIEELLDSGNLLAEFAIIERPGVIHTKEPISHKAFLKPWLNKTDSTLVPVTPISIERRRFPVASIELVQTDEDSQAVVYDIAPEESDLVYSIQVDRELAARKGNVILWFAQNVE